MRRKIAGLMSIELVLLALLSISCGILKPDSESRSISENAAAGSSGQPMLESFTTSAVATAAVMVEVLQELPDSEVEYALSEHGGLFTASLDPAWRTAGVGSGIPIIQINRHWDVAPDGLDVTGGNELYVDATALVENGRRANIELILTFPQTSILTSYDELDLDQLAQALATEPFTVVSATVDLNFDPSSTAPPSTMRTAISTYESGAGYSTYAEDGKSLVQATDAQLREIVEMLGRGADEIRRSWLNREPTNDASTSLSSNADATAVTGDDLQEMGVCQKQCDVTGSITFTHPTWGPSVLYTTIPAADGGSDLGEAHIVVLDANQQVVWRYDTDEFMELSVATPPTDDTGHIFINFNPGRLNGVIVLAGVDGGFDNYSSLPPSGEYRTRFYGTRIVDIEGDGTNEIELETNDCDPSCATGTSTTQLFIWDGQNYVAE